jgi:dipeptidase D
MTVGSPGQATGTTLGADNGIGVAAALALLTLGPEAKLPPLECLFTVDEETGLTGAFRLDGSLLKGNAQSQKPHPQHKH